MKDAERRDKLSVRTGKDTGSRQDPWKPSEASAIRKRYRWAVDEKQPES